MPFKVGVKGSQWLQTPGQFPPSKRINAPSSTDRNDTLADRSYHMTTGGASCAKYV